MASLEERKKALEKKYVETRPPLAYAKLSGRVGDESPFEMLITHLPVEIGRGPLSTAPGPRISLGEQKAISRQHLRIQWNQDKSGFELLCLGKNGVFAAGHFVAKDKTVDLVSKMPLKIGPVRLYFLAAIRSTCSTMSGFKLLIRAFERSKHPGKNTTGLTASELTQQVLSMYPKSEAELGGRQSLHEFIENCLAEDDQTFQRMPGSGVPHYRMQLQQGDGSATATTSALGKTPNPESSSAAATTARKKAKTDP